MNCNTGIHRAILGEIFGFNNANAGTKRLTKDFLKNQGILSWKMMDLITAQMIDPSTRLDA